MRSAEGRRTGELRGHGSEKTGDGRSPERRSVKPKRQRRFGSGGRSGYAARREPG
nr:MAG TPA: hypothetical protein [Caudoviricetes sp.]